MENNLKRAALYVRVSTNYQIDKDSLPLQRKDLKEYAKYALGIDDVEIFEDAGYSGKNTDRPAYQRMMEKCRKGNFTHIVVWKIDRISRNLIDFAAMYDELKRYNITFISKNEQFDTSSAMGEAMLKIILVFAELERKLTSERVTAIMIDRANKGLWNGARMPIGYKWNEEIKYPVVDEDEAKTVRFIYDEYDRIQSTTLITRKLNIDAIKTKRGGEWCSKTVADILRNPFYIGTYRYNYRNSARGKKKPENEWIIIENNHPALIAREQWERVNKIMDNHNESFNTSDFRKNTRIHVFSAKLICGICGRNFICNHKDKPRLNGWRPTLYVCTRRQKMRDCDSKMASEVIIGPFIINYLANMLKAQRDITRIAGLPKLQSVLLSGECFKGVIGIGIDGLTDFYNGMLYKSVPSSKYKPKIENSGSDNQVSGFEIVTLKREKEKNERALQRLKQLYLFDDTAMNEDEYIKSKQEITAALDIVNDKINELINQSPTSLEVDISFIQKASNFIVSEKLLTYDYIDYPELCLDCGDQVMKDFIKSTIKSIYVTYGKVTKIIFINGMIHEFIYNDIKR